jgi:amidohydrolase
MNAFARWDELIGLLDEELPDAVALRHQLHAGPELSHQEVATRERLIAAMQAETSAVAGKSLLFSAPRDGRPVVVLRAEMDGLPIQEDTDVTWTSRGRVMHACGHDVHMAGLVAVMRAVRRLEPALPVATAALFQHSEESYPSGAKEVMEAGALDGVSAVIGCHVHPDLPWGWVAADPGAVNAAADFFRIKVRGTAGHTAYPHESRDAISALCQIVTSLQVVAAHSVDPLHGHVVSFGYIRGGKAPNAFPAGAEAGGSLRALDSEDRRTLRSVIEQGATDIARAWGCEAEMELVSGEPAVINDADLAAAARHCLPAVGLRTGKEMRSCGSDDFGFFSEGAPSLMMFLGVRGALLGPETPLHHPSFLPSDDAVAAIAKAFLAGLVGAADMNRTGSPEG